MPLGKRFFDLALALALAPFCAVALLAAAMAVKLTSRGPALHISPRVGRDSVIFDMPKLRTMRVDTPHVATHLLNDPSSWLTPVGALLRKTSLDELPQLYSVIVGEMSFVGPRPALFNQDDLVALREEKGVNTLAPGITGWAQVNGRDEISITEKVALDEYYLKNLSLWLDIKILFMTFTSVLFARGVRH
ncbi:MAG: sugar transferase [Nitrospinota bacterium]|nr:sugar transferase [Nitrospinota bacterium]